MLIHCYCRISRRVSKRHLQLLKEAGMQQRVLGRVAVNENDTTAIGNWKKIKQFSSTIPFREIIFCQGILSFTDIIDGIQQLPRQLLLKFMQRKQQYCWQRFKRYFR